MMNSLLGHIKKFIPLNDFLNFVFKTALSSYIITDDVDITSIEREISSKAFFSLKNIRLNTANINSFLSSSPIQLLNGTISNIDISFIDSKLNISISNITVLLMPLFNKEQKKEETTNTKSNNDKKVESQQQQQSMIQSVMNTLMMKFNIVIDNIAIKILSFEPNDMIINNNEFALYIGKVEVGKEEDNDNVGDDVLFLNGMKIRVWNICLKVNENINKKEENLFFNINKVNNDSNDKSMFNFFCNSNTIFAMDYIKGPSIDISFTANKTLMLNLNIAKSEIIITPKQLYFIMIFSKICGLIYTTTEEEKEIQKEENVSTNEINILGYKFNESVINVNAEGVDIVILENNSIEEIPKLYTFYSYKKSLDKSDKIQNHFCYYEDNFFFISISPIKVEMNTHYDKVTMTSMKVNLNSFLVNYVNYLSKEQNMSNPSDNKKSIVIRNSKLFTSISSRSSRLSGSLYESVNSFDNDSSLFESAIEEDDINVIDNYIKLIDYEFKWEQMKIVDISNIVINSYANDINSVMNIEINDISFEIHLVILFALFKIMKGNKFFDSNVTKSIIFNTNNINTIIREHKEPIIEDSKKKSQTFIEIHSLSFKLYNFKRDFKKVDGNEYFYNYYLSEVYPFTISKPLNPQIKKVSISEMKSKEYIHCLLPDINVLLSSSSKESEILLNASDIQMNYNYYSLISFNNSNDSHKEFLTGLAAPIKTSDIIYYNVDITALMNKNEMKFRNRIISMKSKKGKTLIDITLKNEIIMNIEKCIYNELMLFNDNFFIGFNMIQIYSTFIDKVYQEKVSLLLSYCGIVENKIIYNESKEQSKIVITGEISSMIIFVNKNNTMNVDEGNLIKIPINKTSMNYTIISGNPINNINVIIEDFQLQIRKQDNSYLTLFSKVTSSLEPFVIMDISFQNVKKNPNVIQLENEDHSMKLNLTEVIDDYNYEDFILNHQLPMDDMKFNIQLSTNSLMIPSLYSSINSIKDTFKEIMNNITYEDKIEKVELIPLCENRTMEFLTKLTLNQIYHDIFFKENKDKTDWMRMILHIDKVSLIYSKETSIEVNGLNLFFTYNLNYVDNTVNDVYDINNYLLTLSNENSYLRRIGFTEIFFIDKISLLFTTKKKTSNEDKDISITSLRISAIEANMCKDTFSQLIDFIGLLLYHSTSLLSSLVIDNPNEHKEEKEIPKEETITKAKTTKEKVPSSFGFQIIDDYCNNNNTLSVIKEESELSVSSISNNSNGMFMSSKKENTFLVVNYHAPKEGDCQYKISIDSIKVYFYKGKDFAFDNNYNDLSIIQKSQIDSNKISSSLDAYIIDDDYMSKSTNDNKKIKLKNYRKKLKQRDYKNYICISFDTLTLLYNTFDKEDELSHCFISFDISRFEIEDHLEASKYKKMISKYNYEETLQHFITVSIDMKSNDKERNIDSDVTIVPLNILIDQKTLLFLLKFVMQPMKKEKEENMIDTFEVVDMENEMKEVEDVKEDIVTYLKIEVKKFSINFSYNSNELDLHKLKNKDYLQLLNFTNITDLIIKFKQYKSKYPTELSKEINNMISFYTDDIVKNQILSATLHSVAVFRPFTSLVDGFIDIFKQPYIYYKKGNLRKGFRVGFKSCFSKLTIQTLFLGEKITKVITTIGKSNRDTSLNKTSYYKRWMYKLDENKRKYDGHFLKK